jgi:5-methylcytosine-specific restriction endonuclease McrA
VGAGAKRWISMKKTSRTYHSNRYISYKTCKWCGLTKELSEFYDGRWGKKCKVCVKARVRTARHAGRGSFTAQEFRELCERYGNKCLACGDTEAVLEADHVVPLTRGGSDSINNIQPLCGSCNRKKFVNVIDYRLNTNILS